MHEGKTRDEWSRASLLCCLVANANRDPSKRRKPFSVIDFDPTAQREEAERANKKADLAMIRSYFKSLQARKKNGKRK